MQLRSGAQYQMIDKDVPQGLPQDPPHLEIVDVLNYKGQYMIYGFKPTHAQHVYAHGFEPIADRAVACVVLPQASTDDVEFLCGVLRGRRIQVQMGNELLSIVNWAARLGDLWWTEPGRTATKGELLKRAETVVNIYDEWQRLGRFPRWVVIARNKEHGSPDPGI